jgi:DNA invertase Pin-like site-specific DNA recombinase
MTTRSSLTNSTAPTALRVPMRAIGYIGPRKFSRLVLTYRGSVEAIDRTAAQVAGKEGRPAKVVDIFSDEELVDGQTWSGANKMAAAIEAGGIDLLVVTELAHLVRSARKLIAFTAFLSGHGTRLVALREHLDTGSMTPDALAEFARKRFPPAPVPATANTVPAVLDINKDGFRLLEVGDR